MRTKPSSLVASLGALLLTLAFSQTANAAVEKDPMIGQPAPTLSGLKWLGPPLTSESLRGKALLIRWWSDECPLCKGTLPGLGRLYDAHQKDGLVVVGVYHPKPKPKAVSAALVKKFADGLGVKFPVAYDNDWTVLRRFWLSGHERSFTSVSFLIDKKGIVRWLHRGGEFHESQDPEHKDCDAAWQELKSVLKEVLSDQGK